MPTNTVTSGAPFNLYRSLWLTGPNAGTYVDTNPVAGTYTSEIEIYNNVQKRVKPNPLTDTALAQQSRTRDRPSFINLYECKIRNNVLTGGYRQDRWHKRQRQLTNYVDVVAPEPAWSNSILAYIAGKRINLGSSLAEYRATGSMFAQFAEAMHTGYQVLKGRAPRHLEVTPCTIAAADLAYAFGVKPLSEDLFSSVEELNLRLGTPINFPFRKTFTTKASATKPNLNTGLVEFKQCYTGNIRVDVQKSDYVKVQVKLRPDTRTFNFGNPLLWAWELIPYSFVVDWGVGVGAYLEALDQFTSVQSIKGTRTRREQKVIRGNEYCPNYLNVPIKGSLAKLSVKSHERFLQNSIPLPSLPRWEPSATWTKVRRAVALLVVAESGRSVKDLIKGPYSVHRNNLCGGAVRKPTRIKRPGKTRMPKRG